MGKSFLEDLEEVLASLPPSTPAKRLVTGLESVAEAAREAGVPVLFSPSAGDSVFEISDPPPTPAVLPFRVLGPDPPSSKMIGFSAYEDVGIGIVNPSSSSSITLLERPAANGSGTLRTVWSGTRAVMELDRPGTRSSRVGYFRDGKFTEHDFHKESRRGNVPSWDPVADRQFVIDSLEVVSVAEVMES
jgi:hypothetical protein